MSIPTRFDDGTISIETDSATVVGIGTAFSTVARKNSMLVVPRAGGGWVLVGFVASDPESADEEDHPQDLEIELAAPWTGDPLEDENYQLIAWRAGADLAEQFLLLWGRISGKGLFFVTDGIPTADIGRDNDVAFVPYTQQLYAKVAGIWQLINRPIAPNQTVETAAGLDDYADEDTGFTVFVEDEQASYMLATSGEWIGPIYIRGQAAALAEILAAAIPNEGTDAETLALGLADGDALFHTFEIADDRTLGFPTNVPNAGVSFYVEIKQDANGGHALAYAEGYEGTDGRLPLIADEPAAETLLAIFVRSIDPPRAFVFRTGRNFGAGS
ncbi:hypothetical protein A7A08_01717 [Methyloligella halotolerans]|uniref:Uncharacterized protein n=1 Tax=Methyloligella halotolerans TaxID=1177755 RepID=A0A1E2RZU6_9HYPH|nr:hypothetical protein [Methyloligella halotolerans]ODA67682.1 hypothetical protein A7A08_01717 [Methyloligella halotolerans]